MGNNDFIEWLKHDEHYTESERPLKWNDVLAHRREFSKFTLKRFALITRLRRRVPFFDRDFFRQVDHALLAAAPPLRYFASGLVVYLEK